MPITGGAGGGVDPDGGRVGSVPGRHAGQRRFPLLPFQGRAGGRIVNIHAAGAGLDLDGSVLVFLCAGHGIVLAGINGHGSVVILHAGGAGTGIVVIGLARVVVHLLGDGAVGPLDMAVVIPLGTVFLHGIAFGKRKGAQEQAGGKQGEYPRYFVLHSLHLPAQTRHNLNRFMIPEIGQKVNEVKRFCNSLERTVPP